VSCYTYGDRNRRAPSLDWNILEAKILSLQRHSIIFLDICDVQATLQANIREIMADTSEPSDWPPLVEVVAVCSKDNQLRQNGISSISRNLLKLLQNLGTNPPSVDLVINLFHRSNMVDEKGDEKPSIYGKPVYTILRGQFSPAAQLGVSHLQ
jgi:hypothetical protein